MNELALIGVHILRLRREKHMSQEELALLSGRTRAYLSGLEAGRRNVTVKTLKSLAVALDVEVIDFFRPLP